MTDRSSIVAEYYRREAEAGGKARASPQCIVEAMDILAAVIRDALLRHWTMMGAG